MDTAPCCSTASALCPSTAPLVLYIREDVPLKMGILVINLVPGPSIPLTGMGVQGMPEVFSFYSIMLIIYVVSQPPPHPISCHPTCPSPVHQPSPFTPNMKTHPQGRVFVSSGSLTMALTPNIKNMPTWACFNVQLLLCHTPSRWTQKTIPEMCSSCPAGPRP